MKKIIITTILFKILCIRSSDAQNFFPLTPGFNSIVRSLFYDSSTNVLYAGGNFWKMAGNIVTMEHISQWNGTSWDSLGTGLWGNVYSIVKYNGYIYAGGNFALVNNTDTFLTANIGYWDGTYWQLPPGGVFANSAVWELFVSGNDLYVGGSFDTINGMHAQGIARYDGSSWYSYPAIDPSSGAVTSIAMYNTELYIGGNFDAGTGKADIAKYDGTNWVSVGGGLSGGASIIDGMLVWQGELYIVGLFQTAWGDPGSCIAKWNGTTWSSVGTGTTGGQLFGITAFNNKIYVGGNFFTIGGIACTHIAKWDGTNWNSLGSTFNNGVNCFASHGNDLYIGGGFITIDSDTMMRITRYSPPLAIEENNIGNIGIIITPNPAYDVIQINSTLNFEATELIFYDASGREVIEKKFNKNTSFSVKELNEGIYFYKIKDAKGREEYGKLIKE